MYDLRVESKDIQQFEKMILINILGVLNALEEQLITIEEAEKIIFTPYTIDLLRSKKVSEEVLHVIYLGTELEDIYSLMPNELKDTLLEIKQLVLKLLQEKQEFKILDKALR
ncbi:DUF3969 family protein [Bacillus cereus group sp. MYBK71-2]|uniref:DUF3969 family protein n=1 Tax=Bacillus TaxID=1386 RepID=UPI00065BF514|nr:MULTISPECIES: DUF3969 family protein [Bacillus]MBR9745025.1 DUF3969 domain-containing protein [Bacillus cereus]HDR8169784.1 DUF3969 family protein [Bacillus thuringiensis]MCC2339517.1 DUF3969 family protein [Bacillus tropicus]MCU5422761.1 DUF3969 family protein [Bacillus tropicus]MDA1645031.1 DUF3969 family protein [Bacillus cereus group sp. TH163-1LC]